MPHWVKAPLLGIAACSAAGAATAQDCSGCQNTVVIAACVEACYAEWYKNHPYSPSPVHYTFGALAVGINNPAVYRFSFGGRTQAEAEQMALAACRKLMPAGQSCNIAVWFRNSCGGLAKGDRGAWGSGWDYTARQAGKRAVAGCQAKGGKNCQVAATQCSEP